MSFNVIGIGEVLWDLMPAGPQLGGAPANFAYHAQGLGANAQVITRVGNDPLGREVQTRFRHSGFSETTVQVDDHHPTGTVTVALTGDGVPQFTICENVAWDHLTMTPPALAAVRAADAVCFGSLAQRHVSSRAALHELLAAAPANALRIFDINLRQRFYSREVIEQSLRHANVLKLNEDELAIMAGMFALGGEARQQVQALANGFGLQYTVLTSGPKGSLIHHQGRWSEQPPQAVSVVDTVGAGDAFTAALTLGILNRMELDEAHGLAAEVARYVCGQSGATPPLPERFRRRFGATAELPAGDRAGLFPSR